MNIVEAQTKFLEALNWAILIHGSQKYDDMHYAYHLTKVCQVLTKFNFSISEHIEEFLVAILHDSVEDHKTTYKEVAKRFGEDISRLLMLVTDDDKALTREERHQLTYPKLAKDERAVAVKLADRIANVEHGIANKNIEQFLKYKREYVYFRTTLYNANHNDLVRTMWNHLDSLFA